MKKNFLTVLVVVLVACMLLGACGKKTDENGGTGNNGDVIKIGALLPITGGENYYGNDILNAYKIAIAEINAAGGVLGKQLEIFAEDDACDANTAILAAEKIITADPDFVVGGYCSGATVGTISKFYDADLLFLISAANSTDLSALGFDNEFMINSPGTAQAVSFMNLCESIETTRIALVHQGESYTENLSDMAAAEAATRDGYEIVITEVLERNAADASAIVSNIMQSGADMVYWCGYHGDGSNVIKQLRNAGYNGAICVGDGSVSSKLIEACGAAGEGVYATSPPYVEFISAGQDFIAAYQEAYKAAPGAYASLAYDTIYLLKAAIEQAGSTDYSAVRDAVAAIEMEGISGTLSFDENRERKVSSFMLLQISGDEFIQLDI